MGLDVYFIPALNIEELRADENLEIKDYVIEMKSPQKSFILSYLDTLDGVDNESYFKLKQGSEHILKYLAEKYHRLVAADGFHNDSGYKLHYDGTLQDVIDEMLQYKEEYEWSDEFVRELESWDIQYNIQYEEKTSFSMEQFDELKETGFFEVEDDDSLPF